MISRLHPMRVPDPPSSVRDHLPLQSMDDPREAITSIKNNFLINRHCIPLKILIFLAAIPDLHCLGCLGTLLIILTIWGIVQSRSPSGLINTLPLRIGCYPRITRLSEEMAMSIDSIVCLLHLCHYSASLLQVIYQDRYEIMEL